MSKNGSILDFLFLKTWYKKNIFFHLYYMSKTDLEKFYLLDFLYCFSPQNIVVPLPLHTDCNRSYFHTTFFFIQGKTIYNYKN